MSEANPMIDLVEGIVRLQRAFRRYKIEPSIIELSCWEDGQSFKHLLDREHVHMIDLGMDHATGEPRQQVEIAGTIVRWPAMRKALRKGGIEFIQL
ncbi:MAG: hypothetical protein LCH86_09700 [Proteobacteria bacterium]|nr:hypothetical protein [Pseudomonadota bacterium]